MEDGALEHGTNSTSSPLHPPIHKRIHAYFGQEIDGDSWRFILIALIIAFIAGMTMVQFSEDFPINVFAQPQQLFYLATPLDPDGSYRVIGTAFGCFVVAVLVVGQIAVQTGWRQKRGWLVGSAVVQTIGMIVAGSLRIKEPSYNMGLMLPEVAIMATVGGIQIATMRCLEGRVNKVNTIQFFGALVNMLIDKRLWKCKNPNRNIRALFILSVIGGASVGVWIYEAAFAAGGSGLTLLVCAFLKGTLVVGGLLLVPGKRGVDRSWKAATGKENTPYQGPPLLYGASGPLSQAASFNAGAGGEALITPDNTRVTSTAGHFSHETALSTQPELTYSPPHAPTAPYKMLDGAIVVSNTWPRSCVPEVRLRLKGR